MARIALSCATGSFAFVKMNTARHFIVIAWGSLGDVHPYVGLAVALQGRGHRVTFLTHPLLGEMVVNAGLRFHSIGSEEEADRVLRDPDLWDAQKGFSVVWNSVAALQSVVTDFILDQDRTMETAVIAHPLVVPGASMARELDPSLRLIATFLAPANLRTCHDPLIMGPLHVPRWIPMSWRRWLWRRVDADMLDPVTVPGINALRVARGLEPIANFASHLYGSADLTVTLFPSWFGPTQPDWPQSLVSGDFVLFDGFPERESDPELKAFLDAGEPPLVFTFGSAMLHAAEAFRASVDACRRLGRRGILLTAFPEQIPADLPATVKWFEYVPLRRLLPRAAALIHHGGIGTTAEALRAGVPQLIVPMAHDQFDNGARVALLCVGATLPRRRYGARVLAKQLATLLALPTLHADCTAVAARFVDPKSAATLCGGIEAALAAKKD